LVIQKKASTQARNLLLVRFNVRQRKHQGTKKIHAIKWIDVNGLGFFRPCPVTTTKQKENKRF